MRPVTHADNVLRVQQRIRMLQHVFFRQRVQVVDDDSRPDGLAVSYHPVRDLAVSTCQVAPAIPHDDPVPERPPLSRLVEVLVQVPVKAKGVVSNFAVELQVVEPVFKGCILAKFGVCLSAHALSTPHTRRSSQMRRRPRKDKSTFHDSSQGPPSRHSKSTPM